MSHFAIFTGLLLLLLSKPATGLATAQTSQNASPLQNGGIVPAASTLHQEPDFTCPPPKDFSSLADGALFSHWRPKAHYMHPSQITGDPTALWTDPDGSGSLISAGYGNLWPVRGASPPIATSLRGAKTKDYLTFEDWGVSLGPGGRNDPLAVFDGKAVPVGYSESYDLMQSPSLN